VNHNPRELLRTQDLPALYEENSCLYVFSRESFKKSENRRIGNIPLMFPISSLEAVDIDEEEDFVLAEMLALKMQGKYT
jgi:CMP-N-acetylneuraminic acid synthetase